MGSSSSLLENTDQAEAGEVKETQQEDKFANLPLQNELPEIQKSLQQMIPEIFQHRVQCVESQRQNINQAIEIEEMARTVMVQQRKLAEKEAHLEQKALKQDETLTRISAVEIQDLVQNSVLKLKDRYLHQKDKILQYKEKLFKEIKLQKGNSAEAKETIEKMIRENTLLETQLADKEKLLQKMDYEINQFRLKYVESRSKGKKSAVEKEELEEMDRENMLLQKKLADKEASLQQKEYEIYQDKVKLLKEDEAHVRSGIVEIKKNANIMKAIMTTLGLEAYIKEDEIVFCEELDKKSNDFHRLIYLFKSSGRKGWYVDKITRIVNPYMQAAFVLKKAQMEQKYGDKCTVTTMYQGIRSCDLDSVCRNNFNYELNNFTSDRRFGHGVHFTTVSFYAAHYCDRDTLDKIIIVVQALYVKGNISNFSTCISGKNNVTTENDKGNVVVFYDDNMFVPVYIIFFKGSIDRRTKNNKTERAASSASGSGYKRL